MLTALSCVLVTAALTGIAYWLGTNIERDRWVHKVTTMHVATASIFRDQILYCAEHVAKNGWTKDV